MVITTRSTVGHKNQSRRQFIKQQKQRQHVCFFYCLYLLRVIITVFIKIRRRLFAVRQRKLCRQMLRDQPALIQSQKEARKVSLFKFFLVLVFQ